MKLPIKSLLFEDKSESGFTLIEILIAIVVLALMMVSIYTIINNSTETKDVIVNEDKSYLQVQTALARFELDFSSFSSPLFYTQAKTTKNSPDDAFQDPDDGARPFVPTENFFATTDSGELIPAFQMPDKNTIIFFTSSHYRRVENAKQSRYSWVRYTLRDSTREDENGEKIEGKEWVRSSVVEDIYRGEFDWAREREFILLDHIKDFSWGFWDKEREKFVENIRELSNPNLPPRLIQVSLTWIAPDKTELSFTRTFRPLYPFFDTKAEADLLKARAQQNNSASGSSSDSGAFTPPDVTPPNGGDDDDL